MESPDNPLILLGYLATKPFSGKAKNSKIFKYFGMLGWFRVFACPSSLRADLSFPLPDGCRGA
jgi:hypothetical protein